jgi:hypothetical protein
MVLLEAIADLGITDLGRVAHKRGSETFTHESQKAARSDRGEASTVRRYFSNEIP